MASELLQKRGSLFYDNTFLYAHKNISLQHNNTKTHIMNIRLLLLALSKAIAGWVMMALLLFLPAGTLAYNKAWLLMGLLFIPMLLMGIVMYIKSPELLRRRLESKEKRNVQQGVIKYAGMLFIAGFIVAGLDYRYGWSVVPEWVTCASALLFLAGYGMYAEVMRENVWLSRTVHVESEQEVVTTGLYGIVRHPMYTATLLMFISMPLVLGSWWATLILFLYIPIIVSRILDEEKLLRAELKGYNEYCNHLRWRLIPGMW